MYKDEVIWIIGASSGIGKALAEELYQAGAQLILSSRSLDKLKSSNKDLFDSVEYHAFDISDYQECKTVVELIFQKRPIINRIIIMAASYDPVSIDGLTQNIIQSTVRTNIEGTLNIVSLVLPYLNNQKSAQIALCGSVAGYRGLAKGQPYSCTKAAIINLAESMYVEFKNSNKIDVKLINPGFVQTPLTDKNQFDMPMIISSKQAAEFILKDLSSSKFEIHFPKRFTYIMKLLRILPFYIYSKIVSKLV